MWAQSRQGAVELVLLGPALGEMRGGAARLAGDASSHGEEASPEGLGGGHRFTQTDAVTQRPVGQFHFAAFAHFDVANDTRSPI